MQLKFLKLEQHGKWNLNIQLHFYAPFFKFYRYLVIGTKWKIND